MCRESPDEARESQELEIRVSYLDVKLDISDSTEKVIDDILDRCDKLEIIVWTRSTGVQEEAHFFPINVDGRPSRRRFESPFWEKQ